MEEAPRPRKTLSLKSGVVPAALEALHPAPAQAPREVWKCKPCGAVLELETATPDEPVRCGACGARIGPLEEFLQTDHPPKVRARKAVLIPPPPAKPAAPPEIKVRPRRSPAA